MKAALNSLLALALLALASALPTEVGLQHTLENLERDLDDLDDIEYAVVSHEQIHDLERRAAKQLQDLTQLENTLVPFDGSLELERSGYTEYCEGDTNLRLTHCCVDFTLDCTTITNEQAGADFKDCAKYYYLSKKHSYAKACHTNKKKDGCDRSGLFSSKIFQCPEGTYGAYVQNTPKAQDRARAEAQAREAALMKRMSSGDKPLRDRTLPNFGAPSGADRTAKLDRNSVLKKQAELQRRADEEKEAMRAERAAKRAAAKKQEEELMKRAGIGASSPGARAR